MQTHQDHADLDAEAAIVKLACADQGAAAAEKLKQLQAKQAEQLKQAKDEAKQLRADIKKLEKQKLPARKLKSGEHVFVSISLPVD